MTHVVAEPCVRCRFTDCVDVCPVEAFCVGENCLVIDPNECIDCTLCVPQCPVSAIFIENELPEQWADWLEINARLSRVWPVIAKTTGPLPGAETWAAAADKRALLSEAPGRVD